MSSVLLAPTAVSALWPYLNVSEQIDINEQGIPEHRLSCYSEGMQANITFLENPEWCQYYFDTHHRAETFHARWLTATGSWDDKIVVDIGCGPGNVYATVGGQPKALIGVDISPRALKMAESVGYTPLLADAHNLPLVDRFADIVVLNATLHHCDDMAKVLAEAARLVKPGGILLTDQDPQRSAWNFKGLGLLLRQIRFPFYKMIRSVHYLPREYRLARRATEIHNRKPGDGLDIEFYAQVLEPLGFIVTVHPHNHDLGTEVLKGEYGKGSWRLRLSQWLSGIDIESAAAAQSMICIATCLK
ncbi:class I SAM-dependent methyltransferase [Leptothoe spongobia]|uniref:Class I SAM-dependent methyltransferase n=1 Tax=Leptothoe spongobia TAU-MAC 1115 TaxID=1967444 RepID=A0A947GL15_9CYAN|nr:class I SAM-dependent methyltransferase [Leptothoe spongobia]MBT9314756.1 class I SAM-dependent methyltransferase [Leptothoe spongobia TAU-MAC 1115]